MKTRFDSTSTSLGNVPVGGVFSNVFGEQEYVRLVRLDLPRNDGQLVSVTIGPHFSHGRMPTIQIFEPDDNVIWEKSIEIFPKIFDGAKAIAPKASSDMRIGNICFPASNKILLKAKNNERTIVIDLVGGGAPSDLHLLSPVYEHYVLVAPDEVGDRRVVFDSSSVVKTVSMAAI